MNNNNYKFIKTASAEFILINSTAPAYPQYDPIKHIIGCINDYSVDQKINFEITQTNVIDTRYYGLPYCGTECNAYSIKAYLEYTDEDAVDPNKDAAKWVDSIIQHAAKTDKDAEKWIDSIIQYATLLKANFNQPIVKIRFNINNELTTVTV